jgi:transposase
LGGKKAAVAVAHKILLMIDHLLAEGTFYDEQRDDYLQPQQEDRRQRKPAIKALEQLGYYVTVERVA